MGAEAAAQAAYFRAWPPPFRALLVVGLGAAAQPQLLLPQLMPLRFQPSFRLSPAMMTMTTTKTMHPLLLGLLRVRDAVAIAPHWRPEAPAQLQRQAET